MKLPCEIIRDLLPLYVDGICSNESRELVDEHLQECCSCSEDLASMCAKEEYEKEDVKEKKFADGLKKLKNRVDRRMFIGIFGAVFSALTVFTVIGVLSTQPLKELGPEDIRVSAEVFNAGELPVLDAENDGVSISLRVSGEDGSELVAVQIPSLPNTFISMTQSVLDEVGACTVINWESEYHIRRMQWRYSNVDAGIVYLDSIRTSIFNNKANAEIRNTISIEAGAIHKIIYVGKDGEETVLWEQGEDTNAEPSRQITP